MIQITVPIAIADTIPGYPIIPLAFKRMVEISKVAIAIPDTGLLELPTIPTIREDTVAKKNPHTMMMIAPMKFTGMIGISHIAIATTPIPISTRFMLRS